MADNVQITAGDGTGGTAAADEVSDGTLGTVKAQYIKVMDATIGSTNKLIVDSSGRAKVLADLNGTPSVAVAGTTSVDNVTDLASELTILGSAARTASVGATLAPTPNQYCKGVFIAVDVSTAGTGSITPAFFIQANSVPSGAKNLTVLTAPAAITTVTTVWYYIGPVAVPVAVIPANQQVNMALPKNWGISVTANNSNTITYSAVGLYHK